MWLPKTFHGSSSLWVNIPIVYFGGIWYCICLISTNIKFCIPFFLHSVCIWYKTVHSTMSLEVITFMIKVVYVSFTEHVKFSVLVTCKEFGSTCTNSKRNIIEVYIAWLFSNFLPRSKGDNLYSKCMENTHLINFLDGLYHSSYCWNFYKAYEIIYPFFSHGHCWKKFMRHYPMLTNHEKNIQSLSFRH